MNLPILLCFLASLSLIACSANSSENEYRNWTDVKGRKMQAKLIEVHLDKNEVVFLKDTGKRYSFPINQLSEADQEYIHAKKDMLPETVEPVVNQLTDFEKEIGKNLVQFSADRMKRVQKDELSAKDYYAIYYSAHWCPPCRKFTPQLVSFYNSYSKRNDNFEIIFVSNDRSEEKMQDYMKTTNMPWLALEFGQRSHPANRYSGNGIPCLVLLDNKGNVLADSYANGRYVGPNSVMNALKERLN
jgi:nucleoredoxin